MITPHSRKRTAHKDSVEDSSDNEADKENTPETKKKKTEQPQEPESILTRTGDERSITGVDYFQSSVVCMHSQNERLCVCLSTSRWSLHPTGQTEDDAGTDF